MITFLRRLIDRWQHHGEYPTQRQYRRYLAGVPQATPYTLTTVGQVTDAGEWPSENDIAHRQRLVSGYLAATRGPIVGVTIDYNTPELYDEWTTDARDHEMHGGAAGSFYAEGCTLCPPDEDGDALYDAAVDDAAGDAIEAGDTVDNWKAYMRGGSR